MCVGRIGECVCVCGGGGGGCFVYLFNLLINLFLCTVNRNNI